MTPIIVFLVIVIIAVIVSVIKAASEGSKTDNKHDAANAAEEGKTWEEAFDNTPSESASAHPSNTVGAPRYKEPLVGRPAKGPTGATQGTASREAVYSQGHHESHCDVNAHGGGDKYRIEKVPVMNSIGGKSDEGCKEHYDVRFVKVDDAQPEKKHELTELQKVIVYGEILNNPAFKRKGNFRSR